MLDKSIPHIGVLMTRTDLAVYPRFALPEGYTFSFYQPGYDKAWAALQASVEQVDSTKEAEDIFSREFASKPEWMHRQCLFVLDGQNRLAATASLWNGRHFGYEHLRVHYVATALEFQGKGLAKALMTKLLEMASELVYDNFLYLTSQTWSWKALNLYAQFGFLPYRGEKPVEWRSENFKEETRAAWALIDEKISAYRRRQELI